MRMTQQTDYALRILLYLAVRPDQTCRVADVADAFEVSRGHLLKIALRLKRLGHIQTARGRAGGIRLARAPEEIGIGALVRAIEGEFPLVECLHARGGACVISPACKMKAMFHEALDAYLAVLDSFTLADAARNGAMLRPLLGLDRDAA